MNATSMQTDWALSLDSVSWKEGGN